MSNTHLILYYIRSFICLATHCHSELLATLHIWYTTIPRVSSLYRRLRLVVPAVNICNTQRASSIHIKEWKDFSTRSLMSPSPSIAGGPNFKKMVPQVRKFV